MMNPFEQEIYNYFMFHVQINVTNVQVHYNLIVLEYGCYKLKNFVLIESNFFYQKFTSEEEGWIAKGNIKLGVIGECLDKSLYGGFGEMGSGVIAYKTFNILSHEKLRIQIYIYKIGSWDHEDLIFEVDVAEIWKRKFIIYTESNLSGGGWTDSKVYVDEILYIQVLRLLLNKFKYRWILVFQRVQINVSNEQLN